MLAERGEVAVTCEELDELRSLAASGSDSAELAQETADLIALLHQARSSNASVRASQHVPCSASGMCFTCNLLAAKLNLDGLGWHACFANHLHACIQVQCLGVQMQHLHVVISACNISCCSLLSIVHTACDQRQGIAQHPNEPFPLQLRRERDRLRHKMDMFKKALSSELLTMQLKGASSSDSTG